MLAVTQFCTGALLFLLLLVPERLTAIDDAFIAGKDTKASAELEREEKILNARIRELCDSLKRMYTLRNISRHVTLTPVRTIFNTGKDDEGEYIELLAYVPVTGEHNLGKPVGTNAKSMRLYFSGEELVKIRTIVDHRNFQNDSQYFTTALHPAPTKDDPDAMIVTTSLNRSPENAEKNPDYKQTLKNFENSPANPAKMKFKRDFYVPHLATFEHMFRQTFELQKRNATGKDVATLQRLQKSMR